MGVTAILITKNEADRVEPCLASITWADEILVSDSFSGDGTREIAVRAGAQVFEEAWKGYSSQKNGLIARAKHEWVLSIDADERVTPELADEMRAAMAAGTSDGFAVPRRSWFLGRWITGSGWYPDYQIRLFRKDKGRFQAKRVHEGVHVDGSVNTLRHDLLHEPYRHLSHYFEKFNEYTTLAAEDLRDRGVRSSMETLFSHPIAVWIKAFVLKRGWRDGVPGFAIATLAAFNTFVKYAKLWELQQSANEATKAK